MILIFCLTKIKIIILAIPRGLVLLSGSLSASKTHRHFLKRREKKWQKKIS